jgi:hypothetical protein
MKLTDEEKEELQELYDAYKDAKDVDSLKLLGGLIRTSKWYKNHKVTLQCIHSYIWRKDIYSHYYDGEFYYIDLNMRCILRDLCDHVVIESDEKYFLILAFLNRLINTKNVKLYKPL